jgi:primosomal protein N' (replication factor Y)
VKCGSTTFKQLRAGTSKVREELQALALRSVGEVTGESASLPGDGVLVGTEAVLHRVGRADAVAFLDFDQELMVPRFRAAEDALVLLARASRLVGGHDRDGVVLVQTRQPEHEVIDAALHGDPTRFSDVDRERRRLMQWPPFTALARVSGTAADAYVEELQNVEKLGPVDGIWLVRAPNHQTLCDALAAVPRPSGNKLRVEVDPSRA